MTVWENGQAGLGEKRSSTSDRPSKTTASDNYVPLRDRLTSWWNGTTTGKSPTGAGNQAAQVSIDGDDRDQPDVWSPARMKIAQDVYGEGFIEPGGAQFARKLLAPANADPSMTILDLSVGVGGTAIALARQTEVWIEALEPESSLIAPTRDLVRTNMLSRKISIQSVDYSEFELKGEKYDVIYSRDRLFTSPNKARIISQAAGALKKNGKLLILDYLVASGDNGSSDYVHWIESEPEHPLPWTEERYLGAIAEAGLKLRASHDFSSQYVAYIEAGWQKLLRDLESNAVDRPYVNALIREGELWLARSRVLKTGAVRATRLLATRI